MSVEMATEAPIVYASPEQRRARALLNNRLLERARALVSDSSLEKPWNEYVTSDPGLLRELSESLDFSGIYELSSLQDRIYDAITDPRNIDKTIPVIANNLNLREANFQKRKRKAYGHLGVGNREQASVFRAAHEFAQTRTQNMTLSPEVL